jgi:gluconolactonase
MRLAIALALCLSSAAFADHRAIKPDAVVDLATSDGAALVRATWRYADAKVIDVEHRAVGPDLKPSGPPNRTQDVSPQAGPADFDDSAWPAIAPESLRDRRGNGRLSFNWYRTRLTLPDRFGDTDVGGATVVLEIVVDDYSEVWVDGRLPQVLGQSGAGMVRGWNAPQRVVLTRSAKPGQAFTVAVFGANGPLSRPPGNFIWVRSATLDVYRPGRFDHRQTVPLDVVRLDPTLDQILGPKPTLERLATGFGFTEGPVWIPASDDTAAQLLFSDPNNNTIYRWSDEDGVSIFRPKSGYAGLDIARYNQPGSNGLALDPQRRLTICEHGNRRVTRLEKNGTITVLADRFNGKRLNSPNDLVYRSDGALFFTDPPFGLPKFHDDPRREQPHSGVYALVDGHLKLVSTDLTGPNGIAFSPDERHLYVTNWDEKRKVVMRYEVGRGGELTAGQVFFDLTRFPGEEALDGLKIDRRGNLFLSGPGGLWIVSPSGTALGRLAAPELPANFAWDDAADGRTLYLTARGGLYRLRLQ